MLYYQGKVRSNIRIVVNITNIHSPSPVCSRVSINRKITEHYCVAKETSAREIAKDFNNNYYKSAKPRKCPFSETMIIAEFCKRPCCYSWRKQCRNFNKVNGETPKTSTWLSVLECFLHTWPPRSQNTSFVFDNSIRPIFSPTVGTIRSGGRPSKFEYRAFNFSSKVYKLIYVSSY